MATSGTMPAPSPTTRNPFARPRTENTAFSRSSLLPARSPSKPKAESAKLRDREPLRPALSNSALPPAPPLGIPLASTTATTTPAPTAHTTPGPKAGSAAATPSLRRQAWRLLWRGGLEVGPDGWRLDGVTFVAHLAFGTATPSQTFASPAGTSAAPAAFGDLPSTDTDLCLSLESMRGRKYLQVRGIVPLSDDDIDVDDAGVQMSITSPLLAAFFTGLLCRNPKLSPQGRTTTGVVIGLGDEGVDPTASSVIVYGQRQDGNGEPSASLRLCVGRRRVVAPPSEKKIRPGEPLPRAPLLFPKAPKRLPLPIPRRSLSRAQSVSSIYAPPPSAVPRSETPSLPTIPIRGEKRLRDGTDDEQRQRRKSGRVVPAQENEDEDIFGRRSASLAPMPQTDAKKRNKPPQQLLDNKAIIRKQTLVQLEARGCPRDHPEFKDVFSLTTKGVYFALRAVLETKVEKGSVQELVAGHLDMYLPHAAKGDGKGSHGTEGDEGEEEGGDESMYAEGDMSIRSDGTETSVKVEVEADLMRTPSPKRRPRTE